MKYLLPLSLILMTFQVKAASSYVRFVKPMEQKVITNPHPNGNGKRFEGCGPVAAAMTMGYWETERNYSIMHSQDDFDGTDHPYKTIRRFYKESGTRKAPAKSTADDGKKYNQSYTMPDKLVKGLKTSVDRANNKRGRLAKLVVNRAKAAPFRTWDYRLSKLKTQLKKKNPVIVLLHNIPGCLTGKDSKSGGWHYVVFNGYNDSTKKFYVLSGWDELTNSATYSSLAHVTNGTSTLVECSFKEIKKTNPALFWIEKK